MYSPWGLPRQTMQAKPDYSAGDMVKLVTNIVHRQKHGAGVKGLKPPTSVTGVQPGSTVDMVLQMIGQLTQEELGQLLKEMFATMSPQQRQEHFAYVPGLLPCPAARCWMRRVGL